MLEEEIRDRGREAVKEDFVQIIRDVEALEGKPLEDLLKTDMDRLVPIIGEALLEKFPGLAQ